MKSFSALTTCLFGFVLQLCLISLVDGLRCYQCSSEHNYTCGEIFYSKTADVPLSECPLYDAKYCIKTTGLFAGNLGAKRFCSERFLDNYCTYVQRPGDQREYRSCVYTCTGDGCNGSSGLTPVHWMSLVSLVAGIAALLTHQRL